LALNDNFAQYNTSNTTRPFPKLKKHHPTNLYMLYPMAQSIALNFVEKVKKMTPQKHCPLSSSSIIQNHFGVRPQHLSVSLLAQPPTPQCDNQRPCLQGTDAPCHYPQTTHTLGFCRGAIFFAPLTTSCVFRVI
jgi:hypothetical protein